MDQFPEFGNPEVVSLLKSSSQGFHFVTKIVVFTLFIILFSFGDIVCGYNIFVGWDYWKTCIHPPLDVVWGHWVNFTLQATLFFFFFFSDK